MVRFVWMQSMKHNLLVLICLAVMAFLFLVVGVMALMEVPNVHVYFWTKTPIQSRAGKVAWIVASTACLVGLLLLIGKKRRGRT